MPLQRAIIALLLLIIIGSVYLYPEEKRIVAILDLSGEGVSETEAIALTNLLMSSIYNTGLVKVIDRNQRDEILTEIKFSLSGCTDESCAIEVGKLLAADVIAVGAINPVGSRLLVDLKAVDVSTSTIIGTYYKMFDSVDDIVDAIDSIGGQLTQNFTGLIAEKREVLEYEDLVPLIINCMQDDAKVFANGESVGKIRDGKFSKAFNKDSEIEIEIKKDGFYTSKLQVEMTGERVLNIGLEEKILHRVGFDGVFGSGAMGTFEMTVFVIPNWWFVRAGLGGNLSSISPFVLNVPLIVSAGTYLFWDDRSRIRPYVSAILVWSPIAVSSLKIVYFKPIIPGLYFSPYLDYGMKVALETKITKKIRIAGQIMFFLNRFFQYGFDMPIWHFLKFGIAATAM